jgi:hypothetical protein
MNKIGRQKLRTVYKAYREACRGVASIGSHLTLVRQSLHETHEAERELNDALAARIIALEGNVDSTATALIAAWDAIERGRNTKTQKQIALRLIFKNLALQFQRLKKRTEIAEHTEQSPSSLPIGIQISAGDFIDRLTLLEIDIARARDATEAIGLRQDYEMLSASLAESVTPSEGLNQLRTELKTCNESRRRLDDALRAADVAGDIGAEFVASTRARLRLDDTRAALKRRICAYAGSATIAHGD